jgi:hypothetical protein
MRWMIAVMAAALAVAAHANEVGQIKTARGEVHVERNGQRMPAAPGMSVRALDRLVTGEDGAVGVTLTDDTRISAGPSTVLEIERYRFNSTTHDGEFDASLKKGSLAVVSGKMVKQTPGSMRVRTPSSIMGVRGTEFVVRVD